MAYLFWVPQASAYPLRCSTIPLQILAIVIPSIVKMTMNMHSTLFMGKLDRYKGNWMSWVKPSNNKLIDRCVRYIQDMLENEGHGEYSYEDICYALFEERMELGKNEAIVLKVFDRMSKDSDGQTLNGVPVAPGP